MRAGRKIVVEPHAADRYQERVRPTLDRSAAKAELERLIDICEAELVATPPEWAPHSTGLFLEVSDGIVLILDEPRAGAPEYRREHLHVISVLQRGGLSEYARDRRKARKERRRQRRKSREAFHRAAGRPRTEEPSQ